MLIHLKSGGKGGIVDLTNGPTAAAVPEPVLSVLDADVHAGRGFASELEAKGR